MNTVKDGYFILFGLYLVKYIYFSYPDFSLSEPVPGPFALEKRDSGVCVNRNLK